MSDLLQILRLARAETGRLAIGAGFAGLTVLAGVALMASAGWLFTATAAAGAAAGGLLAMRILIRAAAAGRTASRYAERMTTHDATFRVLARLRVEVFRLAAPLAPGGLGRMRAGDLLSRVIQDVDAMDALYLRLITPAAAAIVGAAGTAILLAIVAPGALPGVIAVFGAAVIVLPWLAARASRLSGAEIVQASSDARSEAGDLSAGLAELKAYGAQARVADRLDAASSRWIDAQRTQARAASLNAGLLALGGPGALAAGAGLASLGGAGAPAAALSGFAAFALFEAAAPLVQAGEQFGRTRAAARRLLALSNTEPGVVDLDMGATPPASNAIAFETVSFTYPGRDAPALQDVSFTLEEGARLAVVGASGSGKSSIVRLMMRFYAPQDGRLSLGGTDVSSLSIADVRARFALVDQRAELIAGTVADNLRLAAPDADEAALWAALDQAAAGGFVRALPNGLDTEIGEQGALVSGGQARRIALARAFAANAPVLLLDEPTEGLDAETEADFLDSLDAWLDADPARSALIVTHRAALLERAREAIVLENGRVAETGPPDALAGRGGAFDRLFPQRAKAG